QLTDRINTRDQEIDIAGDFEYVSDKYENLVENLRLKDGIVQAKTEPVQTPETSEPSDLLKGIVQFSGEGRPYLTVPADSLSAKEALALVLYATHPKTFGDDELSTLLGASWKTTSGAVVSARASELKREGKLIAEKRSYVLSGAGVQWVTGEVIPGHKNTSR